MRIPVEQRRAALAEAALRVVTRDGVAAATTRVIVAEAGMSLASFHYAYRSRDEVFREVVRLVVAGERAAAAAVLGDAEAGEASLEHLVRRGLAAYVDTVRADPGREQGMLELTFLALRSSELAGVAPEQYAQYRALVAELLAAAAEVSGMRWTLPVDALARTVVALSDGLTIAALVDGAGAELDAALDLITPAIVAHAVPAAPSERTPA